MTRRWYQIAGEWHLGPNRGHNGTRCGGIYIVSTASTVECEGVPVGAVCPDCYRSTKTQGEIDAIARALHEMSDADVAREIALLIGATRS